MQTPSLNDAPWSMGHASWISIRLNGSYAFFILYLTCTCDVLSRKDPCKLGARRYSGDEIFAQHEEAGITIDAIDLKMRSPSSSNTFFHSGHHGLGKQNRRSKLHGLKCALVLLAVAKRQGYSRVLPGLLFQGYSRVIPIVTSPKLFVRLRNSADLRRIVHRICRKVDFHEFNCVIRSRSARSGSSQEFCTVRHWPCSF